MPTVTLNASPTSVNAGQTVTLSWSSTNATDLEIQPGVGKVAPQGSTPVNPTESTTYTITATGAGGSATASAHVDVTAPPKAAPTPAPPSVSELFEQNVKDAFYDFDKSDVREDARAALTKDAEFLRSYPQVRVSIEGHCDERGSTEYNLGLGQRRPEHTDRDTARRPRVGGELRGHRTNRGEEPAGGGELGADGNGSGPRQVLAGPAQGKPYGEGL